MKVLSGAPLLEGLSEVHAYPASQPQTLCGRMDLEGSRMDLKLRDPQSITHVGLWRVVHSQE